MVVLLTAMRTGEKKYQQMMKTMNGRLPVISSMSLASRLAPATTYHKSQGCFTITILYVFIIIN